MNLDLLPETLNAMLASPITFVAIGLTFSLGLWRAWWWTPAAVAFVAGCASALLFYKHWQQLGINVAWQGGQVIFLFMIYTYPAFAVARMVIRLKSSIGDDNDA